jgi:hypothetical protein
VTNAFSARLREKRTQDAGGATKRKRAAAGAAVAQEGPMGRSEYEYRQWRRVLGAFQLTAPVRPKEMLLFREERHLSVLQWIAQSIPQGSRWYSVFERYIDVVGSRVIAFGGDPRHVLPSPYGWPKRHHEPEPHPGPRPPGEERHGYSGKITGLVFDRFGDFEGFILETEEEERCYYTREREIETIAERAWRERLRIKVLAERDEPKRADSIIILKPPVHI